VWLAAIAASLLALGFSTGRARAAEDSWAHLQVPATVTAGEAVVLALGEAPRDVDELEILLSLDDGRTFPVRVTREIGAGERRVLWEVPAMATGAARLRVRFGQHRGGAREVETWGPSSAPFAIVTRGEKNDLHVFHENGWWEGLDPAPAPAAGHLDASAPRFVAGEAAPSLAPTPTAVSIGRAPARLVAIADGPAPARPAFPDHSTIGERYFPLRN
jgi:hypothetical protein